MRYVWMFSTPDVTSLSKFVIWTGDGAQAPAYGVLEVFSAGGLPSVQPILCHVTFKVPITAGWSELAACLQRACVPPSACRFLPAVCCLLHTARCCRLAGSRCHSVHAIAAPHPTLRSHH